MGPDPLYRYFSSVIGLLGTSSVILRSIKFGARLYSNKSFCLSFLNPNQAHY